MAQLRFGDNVVVPAIGYKIVPDGLANLSPISVVGGVATRRLADMTGVFDNVTAISDEALRSTFRLFATNQAITEGVGKITGTADLRKVVSIGERGLYNSFMGFNKTVTQGLETVKGFDELVSVGNAGMQAAFRYNPSLSGVISFPKLVSLDDYAMNNTFNGLSGITGEVVFAALTTVTVSNFVFSNTFAHTGITKLEFPVLESELRLLNTCDGCEILTSFSASKAPILYLNSSCRNCTALATASMPAVTVISYGANAFSGCSSLVSVDVSSLVTISGSCASMFKDCTALASITFPALYNFQAINAFGTSATTYIFSGCTGLTEIHFKASAQSAVEALPGYADKWGATNATIYFDL